jgi:hypothetical protein
VLDINQIAGPFNEILEGKVLVVHDESEGKKGNKNYANRLKGIGTRTTQQIQVKHAKSHKTQNVSNLIITTNELAPVPIPVEDRHYMVLKVSNLHLRDRPYFAQLDSLTSSIEFWENLLTFFTFMVDTSNYDLQAVPFLKDKYDMMMTCMNDVLKWCVSFYDQLTSKDGMTQDEVIAHKPRYMKSTDFTKILREKYCTNTPTHRMENDVNRSVRIWKLRGEYVDSLRDLARMKASLKNEEEGGAGAGAGGEGEDGNEVFEVGSHERKKGPGEWNRRRRMQILTPSGSEIGSGSSGSSSGMPRNVVISNLSNSFSSGLKIEDNSLLDMGAGLDGNIPFLVKGGGAIPFSGNPFIGTNPFAQMMVVMNSDGNGSQMCLAGKGGGGGGGGESNSSSNSSSSSSSSSSSTGNGDGVNVMLKE